MSKNKKRDEVERLQETVKQDASNEIDIADKVELVSTKKVIYIEIDDEVTTVYDKIKKLSTKNIYIVLPHRAILFQSIINLKILKRKADKAGKKIYFVTNDSNGVYLAQQVGITVYNQMNNQDGPALFSTEVNDDKLRITPLKATVNSLESDAPTRLKEKKISISEILRKNRGDKKYIDVTKIKGKKAETKAKKERPRFAFNAPNRHALISLIVVSVSVLLMIIYIALPSATVYITPTASVLEKSVNITLADAVKNRVELSTGQSHMIASYPVTVTSKRSITHFATGKRFSERGANASGKIIIINTSDSEWQLIAETRLQNDDGLVFRIKKGVTVPSVSNSGPGTVEVFVVADIVDAYGLIVGERGNIGGDRFFLPGLRESSRTKIYGESSEAMIGGVTDFVSFISDEDVEAAKSRIRDELMRAVLEDLRAEVERFEVESETEVDFKLLEEKKIVFISEPKVVIEGGLVGSDRKEFTVSGEVGASSVYYNNLELLAILREELELKKSPQKKLLSINDSSTSYRIFEIEEARGKIKLTANIKGIEQYDINELKDRGAKLLSKIRDHIVGKDIEDAKVFVQNLPEVNKVEIDSWPAWAPTIPNLPDNIDFEIRDATLVE
ncbi:hypothetical protein JKY72_03715 [Candidatus Gracilibacteria bacterium]|nr:hypothetical protein [Candidatus Gracilibacteria bacterium]